MENNWILTVGLQRKQEWHKHLWKKNKNKKKIYRKVLILFNNLCSDPSSTWMVYHYWCSNNCCEYCAKAYDHLNHNIILSKKLIEIDVLSSCNGYQLSYTTDNIVLKLDPQHHHEFKWMLVSLSVRSWVFPFSWSW